MTLQNTYLGKGKHFRPLFLPALTMPPNPLPTSLENAQYGIRHTSPLAKNMTPHMETPSRPRTLPSLSQICASRLKSPLAASKTPLTCATCQTRPQNPPHHREIPFAASNYPLTPAKCPLRPRNAPSGLEIPPPPRETPLAALKCPFRARTTPSPSRNALCGPQLPPHPREMPFAASKHPFRPRNTSSPSRNALCGPQLPPSPSQNPFAASKRPLLVVFSWFSSTPLPPGRHENVPHMGRVFMSAAYIPSPPLTLPLEHEKVPIAVSFCVQMGPQPSPVPSALSP